MFSLFLLAFAQQQPLAHVQSAEELRERRVTPIVRVVQTASHAVVYIQTSGERRDRVRDIFGRVFLYSTPVNSVGSGVVIRKEGFIVTNYHVVRDAKEILVNFAEEYDDATYKATLVSYDEKEDLALLK